MAASVAFPLLVGGALAALVARVAGRDVAPALLVPAALLVVVGAVAAAALAAHAVWRRRWGWAAGLIVLWPVALPLYLRVLAAEDRDASGETKM